MRLESERLQSKQRDKPFLRTAWNGFKSKILVVAIHKSGSVQSVAEVPESSTPTCRTNTGQEIDRGIGRGGVQDDAPCSTKSGCAWQPERTQGRVWR